jgi:hypothetical protein
LPSFGWEPIILTVDEKHYEESLDLNLTKILPKHQKIEKVNAFEITKPRLIGDIGLRAFFQLRKKALSIVKKDKIDFVYIPIPSFYVSLIGSYLHRKTGVKYGIDYIDPWVHVFPGSEKIFSRHWFSTKLAKLLEPMAVKNASLITGVADGYYKGVQQRNPYLMQSCVFGAMPYGGEEEDHLAVKHLGLKPYLFKKNNKVLLVYAGAMLPKAYQPLEEIFKAIVLNKEFFACAEFHFIGTGKSTNDLNGYNIKPLAEKYGLWKSVVFEYPQRMPYLDVLVHLDAADAVFILGSTEPHYTPSKTYQAVLSCKPIFAVLHTRSTAQEVLEKTNAGIVLSFDGEAGVQKISKDFISTFEKFRFFHKNFKAEQVDRIEFENFSAKEATRKLTYLLDQIVH